MIKAKSYMIYTSFENSYIKLCSIDSLYNNNSTFKINVKQYVGTTGKILENNIDIICKSNEVEFYCNDDTKLLNFRVGIMPKDWSNTTQYVPGNTVYYNGKVYTLKNRIDKGVIPTTTDWNEGIAYTNKSYIKNEVVLWKDGNYYIASDSININETPNNSNKWVKVNGEYSLYCGINGRGSYVETTLLLGDETNIKLLPYTSDIYYTNDESNITVNGDSVVMPRMYNYSNVFISNITPLKTNNNKLCVTSASGDSKKYFKIMRIRMVKNTSIFFNIKVENLYMGSLNVFGFCRVSLIGDNNSVNGTMREVNLTTDFKKENINFHIRKLTDGTIDIYASHTSSSYKFTIEDILDMSRSNATRYLSSALIDINNNPIGQDDFEDDGSTLENLYW